MKLAIPFAQPRELEREFHNRDYETRDPNCGACDRIMKLAIPLAELATEL
jgi:hypothetical protein